MSLDATNSFPSNTAEARSVYLKMGHINSRENLFLSYVNNKGAGQPAQSRSLISAFVVRCLDSNEILQLKATVSPTCQFAESVLSLHVHLFNL